MRRVTTPTHKFTFPEAVNVADCSEIVIAYAQDGCAILSKTLKDLTIDEDNNAVYFNLAQEESGLFLPAPAIVQVRAKIGRKVVASQIITFVVKTVINEEVL